MRVLIVEDEPFLSQGLARLLRGRGYEAVEAAEPYVEDAVRLLTAGDIDALILDLHLGAVGSPDGFDLARLMRRDPAWRAVPIFLMTAVDDATLYRHRSEGAFHGLRTMNVGKPINTVVLFTALAALERC